nr:serine hydrolase [Micromonospora sp. DSM 115978]
MAGTRRAGRDGRPVRPRKRGEANLLRLGIVAGVLLTLVLVGLRLLPGSPLAATAAAQWDRATGTSGPATGGEATTEPTPTPTPTLPALPVRPTDVTLDMDGWWSWALLDTRTGEMSGSDNRDETSFTASLIKAWIAADYLRRTAEAGDEPSDTRLEQVRIMIRDSDNNAAQTLFNVNGKLASMQRLIKLCKLTDSSPAADGGWSRTELSPQDAARLGACIADGRAAGPEWTDWLLDEMRAVRGVGDFGIRKAFPTGVRKTIAIKNGWVDRTAEQEYHVNCLAIGDGWTMAVMVQYDINLGYQPGAKMCQEVAKQLRAD